jgi:hypothetical protein
LASDLQAKSRHLLTVGLAGLGAAGALGALATSLGATLDAPFVITLLVGSAVNLSALVMFAAAYIGLRAAPVMAIGPSLRWIAEKSRTPGWRMTLHFHSLLCDYPSYFRWNALQLHGTDKVNRRGLWTLVLAAVGYALAFGYILTRSIVL